MINDSNKFDLIVIGGGSGGIASAKRSAGYGAKVLLIEGAKYGGTCVNVGCVPKKIMFNAAHTAEIIKESKNFGFSNLNVDDDALKFDWKGVKKARDRYIERLNGIYERGLDKLNITRVMGWASFESNNSIKVNNEIYTSDNIVIAVGGEPDALGVPGDEYVSNSDDFFALEEQPKKVAILGAGYIAVELSGVFQGLGTQASLFVRGDTAMRNMDSMLSEHLDKSMKHSGVEIINFTTVSNIKKNDDGKLELTTKDDRSFGDFDMIIAAIGRHPNTKSLGLDKTGVTTNKRGYIEVNEFQQTKVPSITALGDVCGEIELTPMAIAAGRRLGDRIFGGHKTAKADYSMVPTVVFSHPTIGTIGMTEKQAKEKYGEDKIKVYTSGFVNLWYATWYEGEAGDKPISKYKLVTLLPEEKVVGLHMIGLGSDEVLQGFGVAIKMGATKADFDRCVAIHPTAGEEMVTLPEWGKAPGSL